MSNPFEGRVATKEKEIPSEKEAEALGGQKQEFRKAHEKLEKNDILIGELHADFARTLLYKAGIKFDWKLFSDEEKVSGTTAHLPREFIFRLDDKTDESADKAFAILKEAKIRCDIIKDVIDLDKGHATEEEKSTAQM